jgi:hypothetical protein
MMARAARGRCTGGATFFPRCLGPGDWARGLGPGILQRTPGQGLPAPIARPTARRHAAPSASLARVHGLLPIIANRTDEFPLGCAPVIQHEVSPLISRMIVPAGFLPFGAGKSRRRKLGPSLSTPGECDGERECAGAAGLAPLWHCGDWPWRAHGAARQVAPRGKWRVLPSRARRLPLLRIEEREWARRAPRWSRQGGAPSPVLRAAARRRKRLPQRPFPQQEAGKTFEAGSFLLAWSRELS